MATIRFLITFEYISSESIIIRWIHRWTGWFVLCFGFHFWLIGFSSFSSILVIFILVIRVTRISRVFVLVNASVMTVGRVIWLATALVLRTLVFVEPVSLDTLGKTTASVPVLALDIAADTRRPNMTIDNDLLFCCVFLWIFADSFAA